MVRTGDHHRNRTLMHCRKLQTLHNTERHGHTARDSETHDVLRPRWVGEGVGDCRPPKRRSLLVPQVFLGRSKPCPFLWDKVFSGCIPLSILVTNGEPTSGHRDVCSVGILTGHLGREGGGESGQMHGKTTFLPCVFLFFWLANGPFSFSGGWWSGRYPLAGQASRACSERVSPGRFTVEFVNVGGWLTHGDLAMNSCAQFLAVADDEL